MNDKTVPGGRIYEQTFDAAMAPMAATLQRSTFHAFWQKSWPWLIPYMIITFFSPLLGLVLTGWAGVGVAEVLGVANLIIGFYAITRIIKETRH